VTRLEDLQAFGFQGRGGVGLGAAIAVFVREAFGYANLLEGVPFQEQGMGSAKDPAASDPDPSAPSSPKPPARLTEPPRPRLGRTRPEVSKDAFTAS